MPRMDGHVKIIFIVDVINDSWGLLNNTIDDSGGGAYNALSAVCAFTKTAVISSLADTATVLLLCHTVIHGDGEHFATYALHW